MAITELDDAISGLASGSTTDALGGADTVSIGAGIFTVNGGAGDDTLIVDYSASATKVVLAAPTDTGPIIAGSGYPSPGDLTYSQVGDYRLTTRVANYSDIKVDQADHMWWGVAGMGAAMDGVIDSPGETLTLEGISNNGATATWTGTTTVITNSGTQTVYTKFVATLTGLTWETAADLGITGGPAVVVEVPADGSFEVSYALTASLDNSTFTGFNSLYNSLSTFGNNSRTSFSGQFYYDDAGQSGSISDSDGNSANFLDIEHLSLTTGAGGSDIHGGIGADTLIGGSGDDAFDGGAGHDTLSAGGGNNTLIGGADIDLATYAAAANGIDVILDGDNSVQLSIGDQVTDILSGIELLTGSTLGDRIGGGSQDINNEFLGLAGNDTFVAGGGVDTIVGGDDSDTVDYSGIAGPINVQLAGDLVATVLLSGATKDHLMSVENIVGSAFGDTITGDANDNSFMGGVGLDMFDGGDGIDTFDLSDKTVAVAVALDGSTQIVVSVEGSGEDQIKNVENIIGGTADDTLTGDDQANRLDGGDGDDLLAGGAGADTLIGGSGSDTADYSGMTVAIAMVLDGSQLVDVLSIGGGVEDKIGGIENIVGGSAGDNVTGDINDNSFKGGAGSDTFDGGDGSDTFDLSDKTVAIAVTLAGSTQASVTVSGSAQDNISNVENIIGGTAADTLTGDDQVNSLNGGLGNDLLVGGAGVDTLIGGSGSDTVDYSASTSGLSVILNGEFIAEVSAGGLAADEIAGIENIIGSSSSDSITGDAENNRFKGSAGSDTFLGGDGNDTFELSDKTQAISVTLKRFELISVKVGASFEDTLSNVENIILGSGNDKAVGDSAVNLFNGGAGADTFNGGGGNDTLIGGLGLDTADYAGRSTSVSVTLAGSAVARVSVGGVAEDFISGIENVIGGSGIDTLTGDTFANVLTGNAGTDKLKGMEGGDMLLGGLGKDTLTGGTGKDLFVFKSTAETAISTFDVVTDFKRAEQDRIDLSAIDAIRATGKNDAFLFLAGAGAAFKNAGDLHYKFVNSGNNQTTVVEGDANGDHVADFRISLNGHIDLVATSFVL